MRTALTLALGITASLLCSGQNLRIEIVRGAGANNSAGGAVTPIIRVTDAEGKPVSGALVIFTAPSSGPSLEFSGEGSLGRAQTDETGTAVAPHDRPVGGNGPVEIEVVAEKGGNSAHAWITQINLGLATKTSASEGLNVTFAGISASPKKGAGEQATLHVTLADDKPVADATVDCTLRATTATGEVEEIIRISTVSDETGLAICELGKKSGSGSELVVRAIANEQAATRYFKLPRR